MPRQTINIRTEGGEDLEIEATVIGKFAYHPSVSFPHKEQTITHLATGRAVAYAHTAKAAREMAQKLDAAVVEDITPDRIYSEEYKVFARAVRSIRALPND
jgi:hypothetical protein